MRRRLAVTELETRLTPAYNLLIDGNAVTTGVAVDTSIRGLTVYTPAASGATLNVADIETALVAGHVTIKTLTGSGGLGQITWTRNSAADDLEYFGPAARSFTLQTPVGTTDGDIDLTNVRMTFGNNVAVTLGASSDVQLFGTQIIGASGISVSALHWVSTGAAASTLATVGDISLSGGLVQVAGAVQLTAGGDVAVNTAVSAGQALTATALAGTVTFAEDIYGTGGTVTVQAARTVLEKAIGTASPLGRFILGDGTINAASTIRVSDYAQVGDGTGGFGRPEAVWNADVNGDLRVFGEGILSPAGRGHAGTLTVSGQLTFESGTLEIDAGAPADRVAAAGAVQINGFAALKGLFGNGLQSGFNYPIVSGASLAGTFSNAPVGTTFTAGRDAVTVTGYTPTAVTISPAAAAIGNVAAGHDFDGTKYTVKLTGPGQLVAAPSPTRSSLDLILRNTTAASKLTVTTAANASDAGIVLNRVGVTGSLGSFSAPKADLVGPFLASEAVGSLTLRDVYGATMSLGRTPEKSTVVKLRNAYNAQLNLTGRLASLTAAGSFSGEVNAVGIGTLSAYALYGNVSSDGPVDRVAVKTDWAGDLTAEDVKAVTVGGVYDGHLNTADLTTATFGSVFGEIDAINLKTLTTKYDLRANLEAGTVGTVRVGGDLANNNGGWQVDGAVGSVTAGRVVFWSLAAKNVGALTVRGNASLGLSGDVIASTLTLAGNDGTAGAFGLKTVTVAGNVSGSTFAVPNGNVGSFTAARFRTSGLFVGYTPDGGFVNPFLNGTFTPAGYKLGAFTVTAKPLGDAANPNNYAFSGGQVVADTLGTVRLSGVNTAAGISGVKFRTAAGSVRVAAADVTTIPFNVNLTASPTPLANNFYFLDV